MRDYVGSLGIRKIVRRSTNEQTGIETIVGLPRAPRRQAVVDLEVGLA